MDFKFAVEPKKEEEESGSYERARKPAKKASDEEKNKLSEKKMREYASEIKKIKESLDEDNEDLILKEYAQKILKNQDPVGHVEKKRKDEKYSETESSSESDSLDSDSERILKSLSEKKDWSQEDAVDGRKRKQQQKVNESSDDGEEEEEKEGPRPKKKTPGKVIYEDSPVEPSTKKGEVELEQRFRIDSVKDFHARIAEDVAKILQKSYPQQEFKRESEDEQRPPKKNLKKKMPAKKTAAKKKKSPPKKKKSSSSQKKGGSTSKLTQALIKKLMKRRK